jgi:hypothetical protein
MAMFEQVTTKLEAGQEVGWRSLVTEVLGLPIRYIPAVQVALLRSARGDLA